VTHEPNNPEPESVAGIARRRAVAAVRARLEEIGRLARLRGLPSPSSGVLVGEPAEDQEP
jgi:hypothetical protein